MIHNSVILTNILWESLVLICSWYLNNYLVLKAYKHIRNIQMGPEVFDTRYLVNKAYLALQIMLFCIRTCFYEQRGVFWEIRIIILLNILFVIAKIDWKTYKIPNFLIVYGFFLRGVLLLFEIMTKHTTIIEFSLFVFEAVVFVAVLFGITSLIDKNGIGVGDWKLMILLSSYVGCYGVVLILIGAVSLLFIVSVFQMRKRKEMRKEWFAFAPFVLISLYALLILDVV